jgi:ATP-dependent DNA helicase PIF1
MVKNSKTSKRRWKSCIALIIDEVSMLSGDFFDKLEYVARKIRKNEEPFGGIQVSLLYNSLAYYL